MQTSVAVARQWNVTLCHRLDVQINTYLTSGVIVELTRWLKDFVWYRRGESVTVLERLRT